ncbi:MAG: Acidobacterial duplicated orphan permease (function unknown), partial [uncultured Gemmatimonadetes bacterium]
MRRREHFGEIAQDLGHGLRQLRRRPVFAAAGILTLAVGIGATTAIFSAADHVLLRPLPYRSPEGVVTLWETDRTSGEEKKGASPGNFVQWRERARSFSAIGLAEPFGYDLTGDGPPEPLGAWTMTEGFMDALGVVPMLGRTFRPEDFGGGKPSVALISHGLWQRRFGGDPAIVGRTIQLDLAPVTVLGVLPPGLEHPEPRDVWTPKVLIERELNDRTSSYMVAVGRLRPGVTLKQARADLGRVATSLGTEYPQTNSETGVNLVPLREQILGGVRPALVVLLAAVAFLLLIACGNVANLLLARGAERERELGVRAALGAGRARLVRQLATESLLLGTLGGAVGLLLAWVGVRTLTALVPDNFPRVDTIALDARALVFAVAITLLSTLLFGLAPSLRFSRPNLMGTLRGGSRSGSGGRERSRLRSGLMVSQISLALVLLIGAGLLARSFVSLLANDPGFQTDNRAALQLFLWDRNPTKEQRLQRVDELTERFAAVPGVEKVAVVSALPFHPNQIDAQDELLVEGRAAPLPGQTTQVFTTTASPDYFGIMGIPLRRGRGFTPEDRPDAPQVALISETLARRFFPDEDPIGKRVTVGMMSRPVSREIVGVVGDVRPKALDSEARPELFVPYSQSGTGSITFVMRAQRDPATLLPALKAQVWEIDSSQTIYHAA